MSDHGDTALDIWTDAVCKCLSDPAAVHLNMLRGGIAKPSWANIQHLYPDEFAKLRAERDAAARDMRERCASEAFFTLASVVISDTGGTELGDHVAAAIRALPDTPAILATVENTGSGA